LIHTQSKSKKTTTQKRLSMFTVVGLASNIH